MTTAEGGLTRLTSPLADWYAVTIAAGATFAKLASGAMIGIATVARPDDDGMRNDSGRNRTYIRLMNATPPNPDRDCSAQLRTVSVIWPLVMITVKPRAIPMISATPRRSLAPATNAPVKRDSDIRPTKPMMIAKTRNEAVISGNHQNRVAIRLMPRSAHGMTPMIIATNARKKNSRTALWVPVSVAGWLASTAAPWKWA